jgi:hypothetical protein
MDTHPDKITAELLFELMKFRTVGTDGTEHRERSYFQALLYDRFSQRDCALQHLADQNAPHVAGWCTFVLSCLNIEGENCRSPETLGHFHAIAIDTALSSTPPGVSAELDRVRDFKVQLFRKLKHLGLNREEIEMESPSIRHMLHPGGMLMAVICADSHSRDQITRNVIDAVSLEIFDRVRHHSISDGVGVSAQSSAATAPRKSATHSTSQDLQWGLSTAALALIGASFYQLLLGRGNRGWWPELIEIILLAGYFISATIVLRFAFGRKRVHFLVAVVVALLIFVGWFIAYRTLTGDPYSPSLLLAAAFYFSFQCLRQPHLTACQIVEP